VDGYGGGDRWEWRRAWERRFGANWKAREESKKVQVTRRPRHGTTCGANSWEMREGSHQILDVNRFFSPSVEEHKQEAEAKSD
jgi:hypothetical protein